MESNNQPGAEQAALDCLRRDYGLDGRLERLSGENLNFLLTTKDEQKFVIKITEAGSQETPAEVEHAVLEAARAGGFPAGLPYIQKTNKGFYETRIELHMKGIWTLRLMPDPVYQRQLIFRELSTLTAITFGLPS